ncbi:MAG: putative DNA-binding domain-containing protein [Bradymonadia bacterium]
MSNLQQFFDAMVPFLRGEIDPAELQQRLGDSPSRDDHIAFYAQLIRANHRRIMGYLYPGVEQAVGERKAWRALVDTYALGRPSSHWDLNVFGEGFAGWLIEQTDLEARELWAQIADYEYLYYTTTRDTRPFDVEADVVNPTASIRAYTHTVPGYIRGIKSGRDIPLKPTPVTILFYRRPSDRMVRFIQPTLPMLVAFAWANEEANAEVCAQAGVSRKALVEAALELKRAGILGSPVIADIEARWPAPER